jgi:hypothetical protein
MLHRNLRNPKEKLASDEAEYTRKRQITKRTSSATIFGVQNGGTQSKKVEFSKLTDIVV